MLTTEENGSVSSPRLLSGDQEGRTGAQRRGYPQDEHNREKKKRRKTQSQYAEGFCQGLGPWLESRFLIR